MTANDYCRLVHNDNIYTTWLIQKFLNYFTNPMSDHYKYSNYELYTQLCIEILCFSLYGMQILVWYVFIFYPIYLGLTYLLPREDNDCTNDRD